jgi:predicted transposase/invertase (TIGR01784 family)
MLARTRRKTNAKTHTQPHDTFFRTAMRDVRVVQDFLRAHLPADMLAITDLTQLELQERSYVNASRTEAEVDVLYRTMIDGREAFLYFLIEHQSRSDRLMPFRVLYYICQVLHTYIADRKRQGI